ncbi:MAG: glycosyltransferase [Candidatus Moranbacteria bacterium]|nr:glycosyltransferase [Candidatus Moranbacteria bacterium]
MTKKDQTQVSIIVSAFKQPEILKLCLSSLKKKLGSELKTQVIVVDIEANRFNRDLLIEDFPEYEYLPIKTNVGLAKALNLGIQKAKAPYILSLNPDIVIKSGAVKALYEYARKDLKLGIAGPKLLNFNGTTQKSTFKFYTPLTIILRRTALGRLPFFRQILKKFFIKTKTNQPTRIKGWLMGSAMMMRRDNLRKVGLMDERYFMYFEDVDWCRRFYQQGFHIVYVPQAQMFHYHAKLSASKNILSLLFNHMTFIHFLSGIKYFMKFRGWRVKDQAR